MSDIVLSVDLDFWAGYANDRASARFFRVVARPGMRIYIYRMHEEIVPWVEAQDGRTLVNIDWHSDIVGFQSTSEPADYNWTDFVSWRRDGSYKWLYPPKGRVHTKQYGWTHDPNDDKNPLKGYSEWGEVEAKSFSYKEIRASSLQEMAVVISPDYIEKHAVRRVLGWLRVNPRDYSISSEVVEVGKNGAFE